MRMTHIFDLPFEVLTTIMIMVASSNDGARDIARTSSTCTKFMHHLGAPAVLKVVNFQSLTPTNIYEPFHHLNGLVCRCAQAGNVAAESMIGKALMFNDDWFWNVVTDDGQPLIARHGPLTGILPHQRMVRSFIAHASSADMVPMRIPMFSYMILNLGYYIARGSGILIAIANMCSYEILRFEADHVMSFPRSAGRYVEEGYIEEMARLMPPSGATHRECVIDLFNWFYPPALY